MRRMLAALATLPLLASLAACSGADGEKLEKGKAAPAVKKRVDRPAVDCLKVPMSTMQAIASGDWKPIRGAAVIGPDFTETVYLVAIEFNGGGGKDVGVWATPDLQSPGPIMSVDAMAASFSNWPQGTQAQPLDASVTGVDEAKGCLS